MNIFVGNLSFEANEHDVLRLFRKFGDVLSITIIMDKNGVKSRGFGFVEMPDDEKARQAIAALEGTEFMGRNLNVSPARPKPVAAPARPENRSRFRPDHERSERSERPARRERPGHSEGRGGSHTDFKRREQFAASAPRQGQGAPRRPSRIKNGRRSRSFLRRTGAPMPPPAGPHPPRHDSRRWRKEDESAGEVVQVRRNLKPWQKKKHPSQRPSQNPSQRPSRPRR